MKKILMLSLLLIITTACSSTKERTEEIENPTITETVTSDEGKYEQVMKKLIQIDSSEYKKKIEKKESFFVYFGRITCPDCVERAPELEKAIENQNIRMFYIDTDTEDDDSEITFIREDEKIEFVPSILYLEKGKSKGLFTPNDTDIEQFIIESK